MEAHKITNETAPPSLPGFEKFKKLWDKDNNVFTIKILPGEYYVTSSNEGISTVLGSCISACIRDPKAGVGGMNHFMLPASSISPDKAVDQNSWSKSARYGNFAMELLINEILKNGGKKSRLEVKIFGGGKIIQGMTDVGERNINFVMDYLKNEDLAIISSDVGLTFPRKVFYNPKNGTAKIKKLRDLHEKAIIDEESRYLDNITKKPISGDIDLF